MEAVVGCNSGAVVEDVSASLFSFKSSFAAPVLKIFSGYNILAENVYILILCRVQFVEVEDRSCYVCNQSFISIGCVEAFQIIK